MTYDMMVAANLEGKPDANLLEERNHFHLLLLLLGVFVSEMCIVS